MLARYPYPRLSAIVSALMTWNDWFGSSMAAISAEVGVSKFQLLRSLTRVALAAVSLSTVE